LLTLLIRSTHYEFSATRKYFRNTIVPWRVFFYIANLNMPNFTVHVYVPVRF